MYVDNGKTSRSATRAHHHFRRHKSLPLGDFTQHFYGNLLASVAGFICFRSFEVLSKN
jgi:hypothetical protein